MSLLLPAPVKVRRSAAGNQLSNGDQIGSAIFIYSTANDQQFAYADRDWQRTGFIDLRPSFEPSINDERFHVYPSDRSFRLTEMGRRTRGEGAGLHRRRR